MLSGLIRVFSPTIDVLWVANQLTAPTSVPPCRNFSTVIDGSIASGKKALSEAGFASNATRDRLTLASVSSPRPSDNEPGFTSSCAATTDSTMPSVTASSVCCCMPRTDRL